MANRQASGPTLNANHARTNTLSLARSPSHRSTTATLPETDHHHPAYFPAQAKPHRSSDLSEGDMDEARGLVEEMDVLDTADVQGFDRPDRGEMTLILGSTAMVILVAVAAGLTTIYDWVI